MLSALLYVDTFQAPDSVRRLFFSLLEDLGWESRLSPFVRIKQIFSTEVEALAALRLGNLTSEELRSLVGIAVDAGAALSLVEHEVETAAAKAGLLGFRAFFQVGDNAVRVLG
ncbi:MAG: hypothetical protein U1E65_35630 [Myxococcota bacterium]